MPGTGRRARRSRPRTCSRTTSTTSLEPDEVITDDRRAGAGRLRLRLREVHPPRRGLGDGRRVRAGARRADGTVRGRARRPDPHGLDAAAGDRGGGRPARAALDRGDDRRAAEQAAEGTEPPGDLNATPEYKRHLARVLTRRALEQAAAADLTPRRLVGRRSPQALWPSERYLADRAAGHRRLPGRRRWSSRCCSRARRGSARPRWRKALAAAPGARLIRLQCHEGIDVHHASTTGTTRASCWRCARPRAGVDAGELFSRVPAAPAAARGARARRARWCC